jgi:hypothetical protein
MAITGAHMLLYSTEPEKLRAVFRDVLNWPHVDAGGGWLIFRLPPAEIAAHPAEGGDGGTHALSFMCDDIHATIADLRAKGIDVATPPEERRYGIVTTMTLPGGVAVQLYEPRHPLAIDKQNS